MSEAANKIAAGLDQALGWQQGARAERAAIVAWLRRAADRMDAAVARSPENRFVSSAESLAAIYRHRAEAISRGDHLTKQGA